jgi:hypothetical protein
MSTTVSILGLLAAVVNLARAVLARVNRLTPRQRAAKAIHEARAASATGDAPAVNAITERARIDNQLLAFVTLALITLTGCGCSLLRNNNKTTDSDDYPPAVVVVSADRYQYPMTNEAGVVGWFVPVAVHIEFMEAIALVDYYRSQQNTTPNKGKK